MPCYATGTAEGDANLRAHDAQDAATKATRAACEMAKVLTARQRFKLSDATREWIAEHAKSDAKAKR